MKRFAPQTVAVALSLAILSPIGRADGPHDTNAKHGVAVGGEANASDVGLDDLKRCGNVVDAAVATAFALPERPNGTNGPQDQTAAPPSRVRADAPEIQLAIRRAAEWLRSQQSPAGNWNYQGGEKHSLGLTGLAGLALIEAGVPTSDPAIQRALRFVRGELAKSGRSALMSYDASTALLLLRRAGEPQDAVPVAALAAALRNGQMSDGAWGYYLTTGTGTDSELARHGTDNSNTQFAAIALLAGRESADGADLALGRTAERFIRTQARGGGWGYKGDFGPTISMTCAGLISLGAARAANQVANSVVAVPTAPPLGAAGKGALAPPASPVAAGLAFLQLQLPDRHAYCRNLIANAGRVNSAGSAGGVGATVDYATGKAKSTTVAPSGPKTVIVPRGSWLDYYEMWSVERVAVAFNQERIGDFDWYASSARLLLAVQDRDGSWPCDKYGPTVATSFALLVLRKANLAPEITTTITRSLGKPDEKKEQTIACTWTRRQAVQGRIWKLSFQVRNVQDFARIVERLGGSMYVRDGASWVQIDKPSSAPTAAQRVATRTLERRADVWQHDTPGLTQSLGGLLGRPRVDQLLIQLPESISQQFQFVVRSEKLDQTGGPSDIVLLLGPATDGPLDPEQLLPDQLTLRTRR